MMAVHTFAFEERIVREGDEVGSQDPLLSTHPHYFMPIGTPRSQWPKPQLAPPREPPPPPSPKTIVVATRGFLAPAGHTVLWVKKGDRFRGDSHVGRTLSHQWPENFRVEPG